MIINPIRFHSTGLVLSHDAMEIDIRRSFMGDRCDSVVYGGLGL